MHKCPYCNEPVPYWRAFRTSFGTMSRCPECGNSCFLGGSPLFLVDAFIGFAIGMAAAVYFRNFAWFYLCMAVATALVFLIAFHVPLLQADRRKVEMIKHWSTAFV